MAQNSAHAADHHPSKGFYYTIFAVLMILLAATVGVAYVNLGDFNIVVAMAIAMVKAYLVVLYFMHVKQSTKLIWLFAGAGFLWLILLFGITFMDYFSRDWIRQPMGY